MASTFLGDLLGDFLGQGAADATLGDHASLGNFEKLLLAATAVAGYAVARVVFGLFGLPAIPHISSLLLQDQPFYAWLVAGVMLVLLTYAARPLVGGIRADAPLFCAAVALLALPTHGGDARNALLDAGGAGVYVRMFVELGLLGVAVALAYVVLVRRVEVVEVVELDPDAPTPAVPHVDTAADRAAAVGIQTLLVLALLVIIVQSPLKGQTLLGVALAGGLGAWMTYKTRVVRSSVWSVAGTLLAGLIAYGWTYFHAEGVLLGDTRGLLAGAARVLPLHYATAGVAGTIYGYWAGRAGDVSENE